MLVKFTISVEILTKINYNKIIKEKLMDKNWMRGQTYTKAPKIEEELGVGKDGYQTGGVTIEATDPNETQTVDVRGTKAMRADKKPVKAKWY